MPIDAQTAQAFFAQQPPDVQAQITASTAGNPNGILDWFRNSVNAGDPGAVAAGGFTGNYGQTGDGYDENRGANKGADWVGKRAPTPDELRAYSWDQGWGTDDFGDFPNNLLQDWISQSWNINKGGFYTKSGKRVDKPTDSYGTGANAEWVEGYAPGQEFSNYTEAMGRSMAAGGGGGGGGGKGGGKAGATIDDSYLQNKLLEQFEAQGGLFTRPGDEQGMRLNSGGIWSSGAPAPPPAAAVPAPGAPAPGAPATGMPATGGIDPLVGALANTPLFSGGGGIAQPGSGAITSMGTKQATPGLPGIASNPATKTTQPGINTSPIESALARKNPTGEWWRTN